MCFYKLLLYMPRARADETFQCTLPLPRIGAGRSTPALSSPWQAASSLPWEAPASLHCNGPLPCARSRLHSGPGPTAHAGARCARLLPHTWSGRRGEPGPRDARRERAATGARSRSAESPPLPGGGPPRQQQRRQQHCTDRPGRPAATCREAVSRRRRLAGKRFLLLLRPGFESVCPAAAADPSSKQWGRLR